MKFSLLRSLISPINWLIISALWQSKLQKLILQRIFLHVKADETQYLIEYLNGMNLNCTVDTVNKVDDQLSQKAVIRLGQTVRISVALIYSLPKKILRTRSFSWLSAIHLTEFTQFSLRWFSCYQLCNPHLLMKAQERQLKAPFCCYFQASYVFFNLLLSIIHAGGYYLQYNLNLCHKGP